MPQLELFPLVRIETIQAWCWNAHARLEVLKHNPRLIPHQVQELLGEMSLFLVAVERIEQQLAHMSTRPTGIATVITPPPAPANLTAQHLRHLNSWPDLALARARRSRERQPGSMLPTP